VNIWITSDTHFYHSRIISSELEDRPFDDMNDMNEAIVDNWNSLVHPKDIIFHLGDVSLGRAQDTRDICNSLNGLKVLVYGNHDYQRTVSFWQKAGFVYISKKPIDLGAVILSHEPLKEVPDEVFNIHGHTHSKIRKVSERHINVSMDVTDFKPVLLENLFC